MTKRTGSSRTVRVSYGKNSYGQGIGSALPQKRGREEVLVGIEKIAANLREKEKQRKRAKEYLDEKTNDALESMQAGHADQEQNHGDGNFDMVNEEQGQGNSAKEQWVDVNEKMTAEELASVVDMAVVDPKYSRRYYRDGRTWRNRRTRLDANWEPLYEGMTDAYLRWRYPSAHPDAVPLASDTSASALDITVVTVDLYTLTSETVIPRRDDQATAVAVVEAGYLGNSPIKPSIAISLKTLELFKVLRQRKPSFSTEAFAKVLCDLYQRPYTHQWRIALADAFDIYLAIRRRVDERVAAALGRLTENWRVLNACPPCTYELEDENELLYRILMSLDGNNSAKRVDTGFRQAGDVRVFTSSYFLEPAEVDKHKLEDIRASGPEVPHQSLFNDEDDGTQEERDQEEAKPEISDCVKNWKAAQSDNKKRVMGMFDETGWFACGCRHGIMFWVADMVRSGEQAKYPLSIINRALNVLGGKLLIGYDIGCAFESTIKSTTLGKTFVESGSRCCVNAYHGYAHNFACQVANHPNNIEGAGIEDLETMERFFSASNATANVIRYASKYRRRLFLDLFLQQNDKDKYANLGLMIRNNYRQALDIIKDGTPVLNLALNELGASCEDLDLWHLDQVKYFSSLGKEPEEDVYRVAYVELLQELSAATKAADGKSTTFLNAAPDNWDALRGAKTYESELSQTRRLETMRKYARDKVDRILKEVIDMELKLGITRRWDPTMPEYLDTLKYMRNRRYRKALDNLQRLVVQRLFELHRLGLSGIGYRARSLLAKALRTRSKAIQNAVNRYNEAAAELDPPAPALDWTRIAKYNFVEEFSLLRDARQDIRPERWSDGEVRETIKLHQRIKRAQEEIQRLNIEMKRLYTAIHDEHATFAQVRADLQRSGQHHLLGALEDFITLRKRTNWSILRYLQDIQTFEGYSGDSDLLGLRRGAPPRAMSPVRSDTPGVEKPSEDALDSDSEGENEEEVAQRGGVIDFISEVATT